jgi:hypothetical protein
MIRNKNVLEKQAREVISYDIDHGVESDVEAELPDPEAPVHGGADARALHPGHQAHDHGARVRRREALRRHLALQQINGYYYYQPIRRFKSSIDLQPSFWPSN